MSERIKRTTCINCGHTLDACTAMEDGATPNPGDITICLYCGEVSAFCEDLTTRSVSKEEFESYDDDLKSEIIKVQALIRITNK